MNAIAIKITAWSRLNPDTTVVATLPPVDPRGADYLALRTIVRTGDRINENGFVGAIATDASTLAAGVVWQYLVDRPMFNKEGRRLTGRAHSEAAEQAGQEAAAHLNDPDRWTDGTIYADSIEYALRTHPFPDGFVATADLGAEVLTLLGTGSPEGLVLTRREVRGGVLMPFDSHEGEAQ